MIPDCRAFIEAQPSDIKLQLLLSWKQAAKAPTPDKLAGKSSCMEKFAQLMPFMYGEEKLLLYKQPDDTERKLTLVPAEIVDSIIRYFHEGPYVAHQAAKDTFAEIIRTFNCSGL